MAIIREMAYVNLGSVHSITYMMSNLGGIRKEQSSSYHRWPYTPTHDSLFKQYVTVRDKQKTCT